MPDSRLHRLEENLAFTERATDELAAEVAALNRRLDDLTRRLSSIESRLGRLADALPDRDASPLDEPPAAPPLRQQ